MRENVKEDTGLGNRKSLWEKDIECKEIVRSSRTSAGLRPRSVFPSFPPAFFPLQFCN